MRKPILGILLLIIILTNTLFTPIPVHASPTNTTITVETENGTPQATYIPIPPANITEILHNGHNITYYSIGQGTYWIAEDGDYTVITTSPVDLDHYEKVVEVNNTIIVGVGEVYDGGGYWHVRGRGLAYGQWMFKLEGDNSVIRNCRFNYTDYSDTVSLGVIACDNGTIEYCEIWNCGTYGFTFYGATNSRIHHNYFDEIQYAISGSGVRSYNLTIDHNVIGGSHRFNMGNILVGPGSTLDRNGMKLMCMTNVTVYDNIIHTAIGNNQTTRSSRTAITLSTQYTGIDTVKIYNNTFIGYPDQATATPSYGISYEYDVNSGNINSTDNTFINMHTGIICSSLTTGLLSTNDTFINMTVPGYYWRDFGTNTITGEILHNKPYYTLLPYYSGAPGNLTIVYEETNFVNDSGIHYGLFPATYTLYTVDVEWTGADTDGVYFYIGGVRVQAYTVGGTDVRIYLGTEDGTVHTLQDNTNSSRAYFKILVDSREGGAWFYWPGDDVARRGVWIPFYYNKFSDHTAHMFTATHWSISDRVTGGSTVHQVKQEIYTRDFACGIGSPLHQAYGLDGVRNAPWTETYAGIYEIRYSLQQNMTLWMTNTTTYTGNATFVQFLNNTHLELGMHFSNNNLFSETNPVFEAQLAEEIADIMALFDLDPTSYCILGVGFGSNTSRQQYIFNTYGLIQRANRYLKVTNTNEKLETNTYPYVYDGLTNGTAVGTLYTHETEVEPELAGEIDPTLFDNIVDQWNTSDVNVTGFWEWYLIQSGQRTLSHDTYYTSTQSNQAPSVDFYTTPANNTRYDPSESFTIYWNMSDPENDTQIAYQVQIDNNADFSSPNYDSGKTTSSNQYRVLTAPSTVGLYYYRVRVWDTVNNPSPWNHSKQLITTRQLLRTLTVNTTNPGVGEYVLITATAWDEYDNHVLNGSAPHNDTLTLRTSYGNNIAMTYNGTHWLGTHRETTAATRIFNTYHSVHETTYDITTLSMGGLSRTVEWGDADEAIPSGGGGGGSSLLPILVALMMFAMGTMGGGRRR